MSIGHTAWSNILPDLNGPDSRKCAGRLFDQDVRGTNLAAICGFHFPVLARTANVSRTTVRRVLYIPEEDAVDPETLKDDLAQQAERSRGEARDERNSSLHR